jgi:hypothetical protein
VAAGLVTLGSNRMFRPPRCYVAITSRIWLPPDRFASYIAASAMAIGLAVDMPNLLTLTVVFGGGNAAHAGQRIMDVDATGC